MPTPGMYLPKCMVRMEEGVGELDFAVAYHFSASYGDFYDHASHKVLRLFGLKVKVQYLHKWSFSTDDLLKEKSQKGGGAECQRCCKKHRNLQVLGEWTGKCPKERRG